MNKDKREPEYPAELETQFIMRLPEEPAKTLREVLQLGESIKNRLTIQIENDMRHGEVRFDHWLLHAKILDLPTIVESLKTIDKKSVYKTADICQIMICKDELDASATEEESPTKNKKKDPFKVDKKFLWPHGITPPTKNVRKRRFRKTLKKKSVEAPEIEKEVKRLLRADNEAVSITWEVIKEDDDNAKPEPSTSMKSEKHKAKKGHHVKQDPAAKKQSSSKVEDIFGGTLSDSDLEDEHVHVDVDDSRLSSYGDRMSETSIQGHVESREGNYATQFSSDMFYFHGLGSDDIPESATPKAVPKKQSTSFALGRAVEPYELEEYLQSSDDTSMKMQQLTVELEELKQRKVRTQHEMVGMENVALRQRFQDILQTLNKDIKYKEMEYQNLLSHK